MIIIPHFHLLRLGLAWCGFCAGSAARWDAAGLRRVPPVSRPPRVRLGTRRGVHGAQVPSRCASPRPGPGRCEVSTLRAHEVRARARRTKPRHTLALAPRRTATAAAQAQHAQWMALEQRVAQDVLNGTRAAGARPHGSAAHA